MNNKDKVEHGHEMEISGLRIGIRYCSKIVEYLERLTGLEDAEF